MLDNILLLSYNESLLNYSPDTPDYQKLITSQAYLAYPKDTISPRIITEMINIQKEIVNTNRLNVDFNDDFLYTHCKALQFENQNVLVVPLPHHQVLGLIFDLNSNPLDYRNELVRLLNEYLLKSFLQEHSEDTERNHLLLLTLFIDLRKYGSELISFQEPQNKVQTFNGVPMIKVFVYGLNNAGKSSLMRLLSTGKFDHDYFAPTKKFRITNLRLESGAKLVFWDMPGQKIFRNDWLRGAQASNILLFVLDSAEKASFDEASKEFWRMAEMYELQGLPIVILINKIDLLDQCLTKEMVEQKFDLSHLNHDYTIIHSSLPERRGVDKLIEWFNNQVDDLLLRNGLN